MIASVNSVKHESHEATCARRYQDWRDSTDALNAAIKNLDESILRRIGGVYKIIFSVGGTSIVLLIGAVATLTFFLLTKGK